MPPPAKNFLRPSQVTQRWQALKESELSQVRERILIILLQIKESELSQVRERILIILLQNDGRTQRDISKFLGCSPRIVAYWCMHREPDNERNSA